MARLPRNYMKVKVNLTLSLSESDLILFAFRNDDSKSAEYIKERVRKAIKEAQK